jgi:hypothetical protein
MVVAREEQGGTSAAVWTQRMECDRSHIPARGAEHV